MKSYFVSFAGRLTRPRAPLYAVVCSLAVSAAASCMPENPIYPLRGEDPEALSLSGERRAWLDKTGATRAVEAFREAIAERDGERCISMLGPATLAILRSRARETGSTPEELVLRGKVDGLGLPGAPDPVAAFVKGGPVKLSEAGTFDPSRTKTSVLMDFRDGGPPVRIPAMFTRTGWKIELVSVMDAGGGGGPGR